MNTKDIIEMLIVVPGWLFAAWIAYFSAMAFMPDEHFAQYLTVFTAFALWFVVSLAATELVNRQINKYCAFIAETGGEIKC